jgi:hypothetical protein
MSSIYEIYSSGVDISLGRVGGAVPKTITGVNPDVGMSEETLWPHGGLYTPLATAENVYIVSTSASDTANTFVLTLLTDDFTEITIPVTPNGTTPVLVGGGTYYRFNQAINLSGVASQGDIYIYSGEGGATAGIPNVASKIMAKVGQGAEISHNAVYTVSKDKVLIANRVRAYLGKNKDCDVSIYVYPPHNPVPFRLIEYQLYESSLEDTFFAPPPYTAGTTFEFRGISENANTKIVVNAASLLIGVTQE